VTQARGWDDALAQDRGAEWDRPHRDRHRDARSRRRRRVQPPATSVRRDPGHRAVGVPARDAPLDGVLDGVVEWLRKPSEAETLVHAVNSCRASPCQLDDGGLHAPPGSTAPVRDHHVVFRSHGGGNERENRITLLRVAPSPGIHTRPCPCIGRSARRNHVGDRRARGPAAAHPDGRRGILLKWPCLGRCAPR
jgi:hypothetical protein